MDSYIQGHTDGEGGQAQVDACGRGEGSALCGRSHRKLDTTDFMSHAKKWAFIVKEFRL